MRAALAILALAAGPAAAEPAGLLVPIPVPEDDAPYHLHTASQLPDGLLRVLTSRDSAMFGRTYTVRAIDCAGARFAYLGGSRDLEEAQRQADAALGDPGGAGAETMPVVRTGSDILNYRVIDFVCRHIRGIEPGSEVGESAEGVGDGGE